jgi:hypothetical protein
MQSKNYFGNVEHIKAGDHTKDIQAYLDYYAIVGDDDGGKMMTDAEFEAYKKKVAGARANHLYVFYVNGKGEECKAIGPSSMCFCKHRYRNHNFDNVTNKKVNCKNCKCKLFNYIPVHGSLDIKCGCHHSYEDHDPVTKKCLKCKNCSKFSSNYTCDCGMPYDKHTTLIETRKERMEKGKTVDDGNNLVAGIGGLSSFSSMAGASYNEHYRDLLEGNEMKALPEEYRYYLGDGSENKIGNKDNNKNNKTGKNDNNNGLGVLDLFNAPNKFAQPGKEFSSSKKGKK